MHAVAPSRRVLGLPEAPSKARRFLRAASRAGKVNLSSWCSVQLLFAMLNRGFHLWRDRRQGQSLDLSLQRNLQYFIH